MSKETPEQLLVQSLAKLFNQNSFSDFTVQCREHKFKVHKAIICPQSPFFDKACTLKMQENYNNSINIEEETPSVVHAMLQFLYSCDYPEEQYGEESALVVPNYHAHVYAAGEKYMIPSLKDKAKEKFTASFAKMVWIDSASCTATLNTVFTTTPKKDRGLRDWVVQHIVEHSWDFSFFKFRQVVKDVPGLALDLAMVSLDYLKEKTFPTAVAKPKSTSGIQQW